MRSAPRRPDPDLLRGIELLVLDFDGVMTDNRVYVDQTGRETVVCHRGDGWGLSQLRKAGLEVVVLSTETNPVVAARCKKLKIAFVQGSDDKLSALKKFARQRKLSPAQVAYMGNDTNDLECLKWAGVAIVPADGHADVMGLADLVTPQAGGNGAVRQVADWILAVRRKSGANA